MFHLTLRLPKTNEDLIVSPIASQPDALSSRISAQTKSLDERCKVKCLGLQADDIVGVVMREIFHLIVDTRRCACDVAELVDTFVYFAERSLDFLFRGIISALFLIRSFAFSDL